MKPLSLLFVGLTFALMLSACGRKDVLQSPAVPQTATEPAKPERPLVPKSPGRTFILDAVL